MMRGGPATAMTAVALGERRAAGGPDDGQRLSAGAADEAEQPGPAADDAQEASEAAGAKKPTGSPPPRRPSSPRLSVRLFGRDDEVDAEKEGAAVTVQANVRRFLAMRQLPRLMRRNNTVLLPSLKHFFGELVALRSGFDKFIFHALFTVVVVLFVVKATSEVNPPARSVELLLTRSFAAMEHQVLTQADLYPYMRELVNSLYAGDPPEEINRTEACQAELEDCRGRMPFECFQMSTSSGYADPYNRYVFGLLVSQQRFERVWCQEHAFSLFPAEALDERNCYESVGGGGAQTFTAPWTINGTSIFDYNSLEQAFSYSDDAMPPGFYTFLNIGLFNVPLSASMCDIEVLERVNWIDQLTEQVCFELTVENQNGVGVWATMQKCFRFDLGGRSTESEQVASSKFMGLSAVKDELWLFAIYSVLVLVSLVSPLRRLSRGAWHKIPTGMWMDILTVLAHLCALAIYIVVVARSEQMAQSSTLVLSESALDNLPEVWRSFAQFKGVVELVSIYEGLLAMALLVMAARTILFLDFHPQLGFISKMVGVACGDLAMFGVVFLALLLFYALVGYILLGNDSDDFRTAGNSLMALLFSALGETGFVFEALQQERGVWESFLFTVYFWSFIILSAILLLNVLLSIIVDSFIRIQDRANSAQMLRLKTWETFVVYAHWLTFDVRNNVLPRCRSCGRRGRAVAAPVATGCLIGKNAVLRPATLARVLRGMQDSYPWAVPVWQLRQDLSQLFGTRLADRLVAIIHRHSVDLRHRPQQQPAPTDTPSGQ